MSSKENILINSDEVGADLRKCLRIYASIELFSEEEMQGAYQVLCISGKSAVVLPGHLPRRKTGVYCSLALMHVKSYCVGLVEVRLYEASKKPRPEYLTVEQVKQRYPELYRRWEAASELLTRPIPLTDSPPPNGPVIVTVDLV